MYGKYNKTKQQQLSASFEAGDIEVSVCSECFIYFKHPLNPRRVCHGCLVRQPAHKKAAHNTTGKKFRHWNNTGRRKDAQKERHEMMVLIRSKVKTVPKILKPIRKEDPTKYKRNCLKCSREFIADSKFQRLCEHDRISASSIGFSEHTHYYVYD